jgi:hypothetical protein
VRPSRQVIAVALLASGPALVVGALLAGLHLHGCWRLRSSITAMAAAGLPMDLTDLAAPEDPRSHGLLSALTALPAGNHLDDSPDLQELQRALRDSADYQETDAITAKLAAEGDFLAPVLAELDRGQMVLYRIGAENEAGASNANFTGMLAAQWLAIESCLGDALMRRRLERLVNAFPPRIPDWTTDAARMISQLRDQALLIAAARGRLPQSELAAWAREPCRPRAWYQSTIAQLRIGVMLPIARRLLGEDPGGHLDDPWYPPLWNLSLWCCGAESLSALLERTSAQELLVASEGSAGGFPPRVPDAFVVPELPSTAADALTAVAVMRAAQGAIDNIHDSDPLKMALTELNQQADQLDNACLHDRGTRIAGLIVAQWRCGQPLPRDEAAAERLAAAVPSLPADRSLRYHRLGERRFYLSHDAGPCCPDHPDQDLRRWVPWAHASPPQIVISDDGCYVDCSTMPRAPLPP